MKKPGIPDNEEERTRAIDELGIVYSPPRRDSIESRDWLVGTLKFTLHWSPLSTRKFNGLNRFRE